MGIRTVGSRTFSLTGTAYCAGIELGGDSIVAIEAPAALTSTKLNVKGSVDGVNFFLLRYTDGKGNTGNTQIDVKAGETTQLPASLTLGLAAVQFGPGSDESTDVRVFKFIVAEL